MKIRAKTTTAIIAMLTLMSAAAACSSPSKSASTPAPTPASTSASSTGPSSAGTQSNGGGITLPTSTGSPTPDEAKQIAKAAYVFGFPLVVMHGTEAQLTNVPSAQPFSAPVNQFNTPSTPVTPSFTLFRRHRWTCCSRTPGSTCPRNRSSSRCPTRTASTTR